MSSIFASSARRGSKGQQGDIGLQGPPGPAVSGGRVFYLSNQGGIATLFEGMATVPDTDAEDEMTAVGIIANDGEVLLNGPNSPSAWITDENTPGIAVLDAGTWEISLFASADAGNGATRIRFKLYKISADLQSETLLFTWSDSAELPTTVQSEPVAVTTVQQSFGMDLTDRLVLRAYAITESTTPVNVSLFHSGTAHYTRMVTPLVAAVVVGPQGPAGTISINTVTTLAPGSNAYVTNVGTPEAALLDIGIPRGDAGSDATVTFDSANPQPIGTASPGSSGILSHSDHVHAHGNQSGGLLHAEVVAGGDAGFMSGTDKSKLDNVVVANIPSSQEKSALVGTSGTAPSGTNKFVDNADSRLTNSRSPTTHATSHVTGGSDVIPSAVSGGNAGLMTGTDKAKLDSVTVANIPSSAEKAALAGTSGTAPSGSNKLVDNADARLSDSRTPTTHATSHVTGGSDVIPNAVSGGAAGLLSGTDKAKIDSVTSGAAVASVAGTAPIVSSGGTTPTISINAATTLTAGSMSATDKAKLDGIEALADVTTFAKVNAVLATANASISINNQKITNVATPTAGNDAVNKTYADGLTSSTPREIQFGANTLATTTTTRFLPCGYHTGTAPATAQNYLVSTNYSFTRISFRSNTVGTAPGGQTITANLLKNGSVVASITHTPATQSDTATFASVSYTAGVDTIGISVTKSGSITTSPTDYYVSIG